MTFLEEIPEDSPTHRTGRLWAALPSFYLPSPGEEKQLWCRSRPGL
jgi:hypothetical protein